ncbi:MAG: NAD(P)-dependent oxidoreductase, partial [bacterium]
AFLINTARGELIDEAALAEALRSGGLAGAAIDVYREEPYAGELAGAANCVLTCHMGSMSEDCRMRMEIEATENALAFLRGEAVRDIVPEFEYDLRAEAAR